MRAVTEEKLNIEKIQEAADAEVGYRADHLAAKERSSLLNEYQTFIEETRAKMNGKNVENPLENMYQLDEKVREMVKAWDAWKHNDKLTNEEIKAKLEQIKVELAEEIATFQEMWNQRKEEERREKERKERELREEAERQEEEKRRIEKARRIDSMIEVRDMCRDLFDASRWFSSSEIDTLNTNLLSMWDPPFLSSSAGSRIR